jgi:hypothetical protein
MSHVTDEPPDEVSEGPYQLLVLFNAFPHIDSQRLSRYIHSLEPQAQLCEVGRLQIAQNQDGEQVAIGVASLGDAQVAIIVHEWPLPGDIASYAIGPSSWSRETKARLSKHTCYALCTYLGEAEPIERVIALYKVALALIDQGAVGIASHQTWSCCPADVAMELLDTPQAWERLRREGRPAELLVGFARVWVEGELWFISRGHYLFGLPELAFKARSYGEAQDLRMVFNKTFSYLFNHGPPVQAGQAGEGILPIERSACLRFSTPSPQQRFLEAPHGTLILHFAGP